MTVMTPKNDAGKLGSAGLGVDLGELLRQLALATHGEHDAARGAIEGVHRAHGSKRGDDEHGQVQEHVDALEAGKRGNRALNKLMPVEDGAERVDAAHVEAAGGQQLVVGALLHDVAVPHYKDEVGVLDGGQAVGDDKAGLALH